MKIAYTMAPGRGDTDLLLYRLAQELIARGINTCGTVQINSEGPGSGPCDMDIQVLPDGAILRISQSLGKESRGCRLDPAMLEQAVVLCQARIAREPDLLPDILIVNKFGKHEAEGRGFRSLIAEALARDIPVLVGLNALSQAAFEQFCAGIAVELPPNIGALRSWVENALSIEYEYS
ncbi:DUF2478 domain-containing protein [Pseudooceanicola sp.]|uniref:DUF2478 domain-containing protein n=1 Tax=Pseudooceanicola sp. TaxID=1914328 RepID=UPI0026211E66|nr:DUF2478 domain-containing protein [Pseudooceanicola sp.]MDF1856828.1 DUF2478 domain-containing protein [Pseudooceanicola sp.]